MFSSWTPRSIIYTPVFALDTHHIRLNYKINWKMNLLFRGSLKLSLLFSFLAALPVQGLTSLGRTAS